MLEYTEDFLAFWTAYMPPKNASKKDAMKAWLQTKSVRPKLPLLLACVAEYNSWLAGQSKSSGREYPKLHAATFLRQERWEGFIQDAEIALRKAQDGHFEADATAASKSWLDGPWGTLKAVLLANGEINPGPVYEAWIRRTVFVESNPPEIRCSSEFLMAELEKRFGGVIRKAFPGAKITVLGKT